MPYLLFHRHPLGMPRALPTPVDVPHILLCEALIAAQTEARRIMETARIFLDVKMHQYGKLGHRKENEAMAQPAS